MRFRFIDLLALTSATQSAYVADRVTFLELLTAQRNVRDAESLLQQHLADYLTAIAELEALMGGGLDLALAREAKP